MTISSRTPEGEPAACPLCGAEVRVEPSILIGDATCPRCGQWLWFVHMAERTRLWDAHETQPLHARLLAVLARRLGVDPATIANNPRLLTDLAADSLDVVELVMELEEELD
jgi:hypothetical protein